MFARTGSVTVPPAGVDAAAQTMRDLLPMYHDLPGYRGFTILVDREAGVVMGISYWETLADMRASDEVALAARQRVSDAGGHLEHGEGAPWEVFTEERFG
jgi:heme-degrading monooxygenase HmoA